MSIFCKHEWKPSYVLICASLDGEVVDFRTNSYCVHCRKPAPRPWKEVQVFPVQPPPKGFSYTVMDQSACTTPSE